MARNESTGVLTKVDRIDDRGNITEHWTRDGRRTICGLQIGYRQNACGNRTCGRCEKLIVRCQIAPTSTSSEQLATNPLRAALAAMTYEQWLDDYRTQPGGWLATAAPTNELRAAYEQRLTTFNETEKDEP